MHGALSLFTNAQLISQKIMNVQLNALCVAVNPRMIVLSSCYINLHRGPSYCEEHSIHSVVLKLLTHLLLVCVKVTAQTQMEAADKSQSNLKIKSTRKVMTVCSVPKAVILSSFTHSHVLSKRLTYSLWNRGWTWLRMIFCNWWKNIVKIIFIDGPLVIKVLK